MSKGSRDRAVKARQIVERQRAQEKRRKVTLWTSVAVVAVLVIAGFIGYSQLSGTDDGKLVTPSVAVDEGTAFAVGSGPVTVDLYEDFMCPNCKNFEGSSGATLRQMATANKITLRYHVVSILDRSSNGTRYSTRAAGAGAAAAEDGRFPEFHDVLYANQPQEGSDGLSNAKLIELGKSVGLTSDKFANAVNAGTYEAWATQNTETFSKRGFNGTPTVVVNGTQLKGPNDTVPQLDQITQAVTKAAG
ncbi:DSBA oxidoreductase [Actinoplanes sp. SE50]|uniref:DsbA family protein n=1 Tax=unclassified Actinoplanes TaxID=2626549 RepID=UPI00023ECC28|nr:MULTISPECIES: thioredoxin domain-containing protein [unclassified Actinoplanes]AEV82084.1 putative disulfide bond formation protein D [Actinoplanes sp. SE50/110]ATO80483.1 DSBA oxidoreductase [Actinoplanes sp. SE50]SLL97890.1 DSBA oxidoreductase [Actinoplanes sp. SE50/110]